MENGFVTQTPNHNQRGRYNIIVVPLVGLKVFLTTQPPAYASKIYTIVVLFLRGSNKLT
jgi:hypothetical protein